MSVPEKINDAWSLKKIEDGLDLERKIVDNFILCLSKATSSLVPAKTGRFFFITAFGGC